MSSKEIEAETRKLRVFDNLKKKNTTTNMVQSFRSSGPNLAISIVEFQNFEPNSRAGKVQVTTRREGVQPENQSDLASSALQTSASARLESRTCQPSDHDLQGVIFRDSPSQPDGLAASKIWPANRSVIHSGLLWAAYLLCLLLSGVQSPYPATSVVTVSANTDTLTPTYVNADTFCAPATGRVALMGDRALQPCSSITGSGLRVVSPDLWTLAAYVPAFNAFSVVLKDSLILGASTRNSPAGQFLSLPVNGQLISFASLSSGSFMEIATCLIEIPGTTYFVGISGSAVPKIFKMDQNSIATISYGSTFGPAGVMTSLALNIPSSDAFFLVTHSGNFPILARVDFSTIKNPTTTSTSEFGLVDNNNDQILMVYTKSPNYRLRDFNRLTWLDDSHRIHTELAMEGLGYDNNILNFGPYQYVVTIPSVNSPMVFIVIISKNTWQITSPLYFVFGVKANRYSPGWGSMPSVRQGGYPFFAPNYQHYLMFQDSASKNFQSYYLTVADCTSRDANRVCQACQSGLVRNNLMPDNVCVPTSDYTGYVADTVNLLLSLCPGNAAAPVGVGCRATDCTGAGTTTACTTCDVANNFYLLNGVCYAYASIPDGYGIVALMPGVLATCPPGCLRCRDDRTACTRCNTTAGFFMRLPGTVCVHTSVVDDLVGANFGTFVYQTCSLPNCLKCGPNYEICLRCNNLLGYFNDTTTSTCKLAYESPNGIGANLLNYQLETCGINNCLNCSLNRASCIKCMTTLDYYWNTTNSQCWHLSQVPNGFGVDLPNYSYATCSDPNCFDCFLDRTNCLQCNTSAGFFKNPNTSLCQHFSTAAPGVGADLGFKTLLPCATSNCQNCKPDRYFCDLCNTSSSYYKNLTSNTCQHLSTANEGFGIRALDSTYQPCSLANCKLCLNDFSVCTRCNDTALFYRNTTNSQCWHLSQVPNGFGVDLPNYSYATCSDPNCFDCFLDRTNCLQCNTSAGFFKNPNTSLCQHFSTAAPGVGADLGFKTLLPCATSNCQNCKPDRYFCDLCNTSSSYYKNLTSDTCQHLSTANEGFGIRALDSTYQPCSLANCKLCLNDFSVCTRCNDSAAFYRNTTNNQCEHVSTVPSGFGIDQPSFRYVPCTEPECHNCLNNFAVCNTCDYIDGFYMNTNVTQCQHFSSAPDGYGADLTLKTLDICNLSNCKNCKPDKTFCDQCYISLGFYKNTSENLCQHTSSANEGYGIRAVDWTYQACLTSNCRQCLNNFAICTRCNDTSGYYWNTTNNQCWHLSQVPNGFGVDLPNYSYAACSDPNCFDCFLDRTNCLQCNTAAGFFKNPNTSLCQHFSTAAPGVGADLGFKTLLPCATSNCQNCKPDRYFCDLCNTSSSYYKNLTSDTCQHLSTANEGFGIRALDSTYQPCSLANCKLCLNDFSVCTRCNDSAAFYRNTTNNQCEHVSTVPSGFGIDQPSFRYVPCTEPECHNCLNNFAVCNTCDYIDGFYMNTNVTQCQHFSSAPDGYGADLTLKILATCTISNCKNCKPDRDVCDLCNTTAGYFKNLTANSCQHLSTASEGSGVRAVDSTYQTCSTANCRQCFADFAACTLCNDSALYYKNTTNGQCEHVATAPPGFGPDLVAYSYQPCTDLHCYDCRLNKSLCTLCNASANYFLNTSTTPGHCQHVSTFYDGFGVNTDTKIIEPCTDPNCQKCAADKNNCTQCWISQFYYMNTTSKICQLNSTFVEGYGANLTNNNVEACQDPHCRNCVIDNGVCAKCNETAGYYMNTSFHVCQHKSNVENGFGINATSFNYEPCIDFNCDICVFNNSLCSLCKIDLGYNLNLTTNLCQLWPTSEDGFGANLETNRLEPCTDPNCQKCAADKNNCTQCWISRDYYMNTTTNVCLALNESNPGFRIANGTYYEPCDDRNCKDCQADRATCVLCQTNNSYFMNTTAKLCELNTTQPPGFGVDAAVYAYRACADPNCFTCIRDFANCTFCNETAAFFMNKTSLLCESNATRASGFRINETGHYERCALHHCLNCEKDREVCTYCDPGLGFYLIDNLCVMFKTNSSVSQTSMFSASTSKATITFSDSIGYESSWADQLDIFLLDLNANKSYNNKSQFKLVPRGTGFEVTITLEAFIEKARLYIRKPETKLPALDSTRRLQLSSIPDKIFPIIVENFTLLNEAAQKAVAATASESANQMGSQRTVANIVLMNVNMNAATLLDRLISDYEYQALIGKQNLTYTRLLLDPALEVKLAPFDLPGTDEKTKEGFIERKLATTKCEVQYFYFRNGVKCGLFENYGSDLVTLVGILFFTILVTLLAKYLRRKRYLNDEMKEPFQDATIGEILKYQANALGCKLTITFGLQFFFVKMEANAVKVMLFSFLNIYKMEGSWQMGVGFAASIILLLYYGVYLYLAWSFARHLKQALVTHVKEKQEERNFRPGPLKDSLKIHNIRFGFMGKPYEELRNDLNFFEIYHPVVLMIRDILITSSIVILTGSPQVTPILICIVEICLLFYCSLARARAKKIENAMDVFNCVCRIAYALMAALTFRFEPIPPLLDMAMFLTLLLNTVGSLFISVCIVALTIYDLLVLIFKKSAFEGRYKTSEDRIKENFGKTVLKYRKEFLLALQRDPEKLALRHGPVISVKGSEGEGSNTVQSKEMLKNDEKLEGLAFPLDSPELESKIPTPNVDPNHTQVQNQIINDYDADRFLFSGRKIETINQKNYP
jgi:hypothetical protein